MTPTCTRGGAVHLRRRDQAEPPQISGRMLRANDNGEARTLDVLVQQVDEALFLLHHLDQRPKRGERDSLLRGSVEQGRSAFHVEGLMIRNLLESGPCQPQSARQELIVECSLLPQTREHGFAHIKQRKPRKLGVQVVRRLNQLVRCQVLAGIDHLLCDLAAPRDDDDKDARASQRHELETLQHCRGSARQGESHMLRSAGHKVRHARQHVVEQR